MTRSEAPLEESLRRGENKARDIVFKPARGLLRKKEQDLVIRDEERLRTLAGSGTG